MHFPSRHRRNSERFADNAQPFTNARRKQIRTKRTSTFLQNRMKTSLRAYFLVRYVMVSAVLAQLKKREDMNFNGCVNRIQTFLELLLEYIRTRKRRY
jgi:membrane glycosyltransferase